MIEVKGSQRGKQLLITEQRGIGMETGRQTNNSRRCGVSQKIIGHEGYRKSGGDAMAFGSAGTPREAKNMNSEAVQENNMMAAGMRRLQIQKNAYVLGASIIMFCMILSGQCFAYSPPNLTNTAYTSGPFVNASNLVGQCTWYCYGRIQEVGLITNSQLQSKGIFLGNAGTWDEDAVAAGYSTGSTPQVGALAVYSNHVAFVESASGSSFTVTECNNTPKSGANVVLGKESYLRSSKDTSSTSNVLWTMPKFTVMSALSAPSAVTSALIAG